MERNSVMLYLFKVTEDVLRKERISIPIVNGSFEYTMKSPGSEAYQLIFADELNEGRWRPIVFFADADVVNFELYSFGKPGLNKIFGGPVNKAFTDFMGELSSKFEARAIELNVARSALRDQNEYYIPEVQAIYDQLGKVSVEERNALYRILREYAKDHGDLTPKGKEIELKSDELTKAYMDFYAGYVAANPGPLAYYLLYSHVRMLQQREITPDGFAKLRKNYIRLSEAFPEHPYTHVIGQMIESYVAINPGNDFIDFETPDLNGNPVKFSSLVGKEIPA